MLEIKVDERTLELREKNNLITMEKERSDSLLLNILPFKTAQELKDTGKSEATLYNDVTVMFTDFENFSGIAEQLTPAELVAEIDLCFQAFDNIVEKYEIEKIKTIGDSYMAACGLPIENKLHAIAMVNAAIEIQDFIQKRKRGLANLPNKKSFDIRIGIHSGPVIAGIVGFKKFAYDIWGDTVNTASRMESSGAPGRINISGQTYELIKDYFRCEYRGKVSAKNKGEIDMYFVLERITK
ncbi:MAG: adenylate/guanylate cyclase domain-containing protein [Bacteroidetes bacterium]|nr:adenylate/guanylate cyclase domain-containing protein [Bacteroidota bacterium]